MSDSDSNSISPPRTLSAILPFLLNLARTTTESQSRSRLNQIVVLDHSARTVVVFEGHVLDSLFHELSEKSGPLPASKASIDAMPMVGVLELGLDCAICLEGFEIGEEVREMPCKHRYHCDCIEKWLGFHGTCPVCRFEMPVEDREGRKNDDDDEDVVEGRDGRVVVVNLWVGDGEEEMDVDLDLGHDSGDSNFDLDLNLDEEMPDAVEVEVEVDDSSNQDLSSSQDCL